MTLRRDAAQNRERVLAAAEEVFAQHGLEASVEEVARVAGVGMGTLYRRFPTKDALIEEMVRDLLGQVILDARRSLERCDGTGLERFLELAAEHQAAHPGCLPRLWDGRAELAEVRTLIAGMLRDAQRHGRVRADVTSTDISVIFWSLRGVIETTRAVAPGAWRRHLSLLVAGLRPTAEPLHGKPLTRRQADSVTSR